MVEVMATLGILAILILSMTAALGNGFKFLLTSKQRAAATQIANEQLERARAIAQTDWTQLGLVSSDIAGDSNITSGACGSQTTNLYASEPVMTAGTTTSNPLYPHVKVINVGATTVTAKVYVTGVVLGGGCSVTNPSFKRVTVIATWPRGQSGLPNTIKLATLISPVTRPSNPDFQGTASYSGSSLVGYSSTAAGPIEQTGIFPPQTSANGRAVGLVTAYKGSAVSALGQVGGTVTTTQTTSSTTVDDDSLTTQIARHGCAPASCGTPPNCPAFTGVETTTVYLGGLLGGNLVSTGSSCSSVQDASDNLPYTKNAATLTSAIDIDSTIPAAGIIPLTEIDLYDAPQGWGSTAIVDRILVSGSDRLNSVATAVLPTVQMMDFNIASLINVPIGVVSIDGGTFTAQSHAGPGAVAPTATGAFTFRLYDPASTLSGCTSRSGEYCVIVVNPHGAGFTGFDSTFTVVRNLPSLLPTTRFTMSTTIKVFAPSTTSTSAAGAITQATMTYALPKVTTQLLVESPVGTTIGTFSDSVDFGQLVTSAFYTAPS